MSRTNAQERKRAERFLLLQTNSGQFYRALFGKRDGVSVEEYAEFLTRLNEIVQRPPWTIDEAAEIIHEAYHDFYPEIEFRKGRYYLSDRGRIQ